MRVLRLVARVALVAVLAGCSSDEPAGPDNGTTTTMSGSLAATDGRTGTLSLTGPAPATVVSGVGSTYLVSALITITGTVSLSDGSTAVLTGTWDDASGALSVSGGGFMFSGTFAGGILSGSFTGPAITGVFSLQLGSTSSAVAVYCGTFTGREPDDHPAGGLGTAPDNGTWNMIVGTGAVSVIVMSDEGSPLSLGGTRAGNTVTVTVPGGTATGTISGLAEEFVKGNYTIAGGGAGTFQGSTQSCTATAQSAPIAAITLNHPGIVNGGGAGRFVLDSTVVFATAWDAAGNVVAAPDLAWYLVGRARSSPGLTPKGRIWLVPDTTGQGLGTVTLMVASQANTSISATAMLTVY